VRTLPEGAKEASKMDMVKKQSVFDELQEIVINVIVGLKQNGLTDLAKQYEIELSVIEEGETLAEYQCALYMLFQLIERIRTTLGNENHPNHSQMVGLSSLLTLKKEPKTTSVQ